MICKIVWFILTTSISLISENDWNFIYLFVKKHIMKTEHQIIDAETKMPIQIEGKKNKFDSYEKADECREELQRNGNPLNLDISTDILV